jgi:NAD-dependent SIR2 family protein deacetylase
MSWLSCLRRALETCTAPLNGRSTPGAFASRPLSSPAGQTTVLSTPLDLARVAKLIAADDCQMVVMAGAGISVSAGIPDFRTPGTGLYDNLQEYGLPHPQAIFDLEFYRRNPRPFQRLCRELWPGNFAPTPTHAFFKLLHDKGKLLRCFTQNIDSLETLAGLPADAVVAAHGNFDSAHVVGTGTEVPINEVKRAAFGGADMWDALATQYGGLVKPDIVFFGEMLPERFFRRVAADMPKCNVLLVLGTSLEVQPFASLVGAVPPGTPRLLINRQRVGEAWGGSYGGEGFNFDGTPGPTPGSRVYRDGHYAGDCDAAVHELVALLGWQAEMDASLKAAHKAASPAAA